MNEEEKRSHPYLVEQRYQDLLKEHQKDIDKSLDNIVGSIASLIVQKVQLITVARQKKYIDLEDLISIGLETLDLIRKNLTDPTIIGMCMQQSSEIIEKAINKAKGLKEGQ